MSVQDGNRSVEVILDNSDVVLDLRGMIDDYIRCLMRYWFQLLLLTLTIAALALTYFNEDYMPEYSAKVTYSLNKTGDTATDAAIGVRLSGSITTLTSQSEFIEDLLLLIEEDTVNRNFWFESNYTASVNLFSVTVISNNYENSNILLDQFMSMYQTWASRSVGTVELQVVDISYASDTPDNEYLLVKSALMGLIAGLAVSFVIATIYVLTVKTVRKESDMRKITVKSCITMIPNVKKKKHSESTKSHLLISNKHVDWGLKQSVRMAESRIEKLMASEKQQVLLVTSTLPQEGKSVISVNLALAFAEKGKKVLILDGDMRNPSVLKVLGRGEHAGLSEFLKNGQSLKDLIVSFDGIDILSGGTEKGTVSELVNEDKMNDLMAYLRANYDVIIIDTPPSYGFTDANILSDYADAVVYVVRHDTPTIRETKEGISAFLLNKKLIGYLINRNPGGFSTYGKYGKYGSYGYGRYGHYGKYGRYGRYTHADNEAEEEPMNTESTL